MAAWAWALTQDQQHMAVRMFCDVAAVVQESERALRPIANAATTGQLSKGVVEKEKKVPKARAPSAKDSMATRELRRIGRPVRKGTPKGAAVSPDSCRGWSRQRMARIRAQREPVVSPAGTGADYRGPEGSASDVAECI